MWAYIFLAIILIIIIILFVVGFQSQNPISPMDSIEENTMPFPIFIINLDRKHERYEYVRNQLDNMGLTNYTRMSGVDGFKIDPNEMITLGVSPKLIEKGKGLAGCASSHIRMWRHIAENKLGWTLILEDDAHFHPDFVRLFSKYWNQVPNDAKIIFPGYCGSDKLERSRTRVLSNSVMCLQGYMINWQGAQFLLDKLTPVDQPIDIAIADYFKHRDGSYIFNGNAIIDGVCPNDYKKSNGRKCMFNGIIYQNHEEQGSTIHKEETVY
jgi:GR25 family glycosyltransferase involved in LPS biosynthesis